MRTASVLKTDASKGRVGSSPTLSAVLVCLLFLSGCATWDRVEYTDAPLCDFSRPTDILIAPLCLLYGFGQPIQAHGGYAVASGGDDGNGFWGGVGPSHLGGGFTVQGPEGTTFVNPPLFP